MIRGRARMPAGIASISNCYPSNHVGQSSNETANAFVDIDPDMEQSMTCMTAVVDKSILSFACYDEERNEIILETCRISGNEIDEIVERFIQLAQPTMVLVGSKIVNDPKLLNQLTTAPIAHYLEEQDEINRDSSAGGTRNPTAENAGAGAPPPAVTQDSQQPNSRNGGRPQAQQQQPPIRRSIPYRVMKSGSFDVHKCKVMILHKLRVSTLLRPSNEQRNTPGLLDPQRQHRQFPQQRGGGGAERYFRPSMYHSLAAIIDFECKAQVQALGSLLSYLQTTVFQLEEYQAITVNRILLANLPLFMHIDSETLSALSVFSTEHHPLIAKGRGNSKEGWSLFSLLDRTQSKGGRQLLREWMFRPLAHPEEIAARQDTVEAFMQANMETGTGILFDLLKKVGAIDKILTRMQKCNTKPLDFLVLSKTISASVSICNALQNEILPLVGSYANQSYRVLSSILERCNASVLQNLAAQIQATIDEEATIDVKTSAVVRNGFNAELDQLKDRYDCIEETLQQCGAELSQRHPELQPLDVVFLPQVGFLVALRKERGVGNAEFPQDFTHVFDQDDESYFKNGVMKDLDKNIGDLDGLIKDFEGMIVTELEDNILDLENELRQASKALSELDCLLAFADCALEYRYTRPTITSQENNMIYIKDGRHPLQEIITENEFVCNDTRLDEGNRFAVVTGPNYSGKSCYLRQVGLLVYMAHIGSFIPCREAQISVTDKLFARICTVETCAVPQSSFQLDLTQMASILLKCTSRSLVLIDEFGKGTSPSSGISLLGAALKKLSRIQCKGVCTTHFLELFSASIIEDGVDGITAKRMSLHLPQDGDDTAASLFKLEDGVASTSAGIICAKRAGVHNGVINRAKDIIQSIRNGQELAPHAGLETQVVELSEAERDMLKCFFSVDSWETASEDQVRTFIQKLARI